MPEVRLKQGALLIGAPSKRLSISNGGPLELSAMVVAAPTKFLCGTIGVLLQLWSWHAALP
jgi:hypothetical protein